MLEPESILCKQKNHLSSKKSVWITDIFIKSTKKHKIYVDHWLDYVVFSVVYLNMNIYKYKWQYFMWTVFISISQTTESQFTWTHMWTYNAYVNKRDSIMINIYIFSDSYHIYLQQAILYYAYSKIYNNMCYNIVLYLLKV